MEGQIPTVPFELVLSVMIGLLFAFCARHQFREGGSPWGRELFSVLLFQGLVGWPVCLYFYLVYPDWSWMYLVDPARLPWGIGALVFLGHAATLLGGYLGGWWLVRGKREKVLLGIGGGLLLVLFVMTIVGRGRFFHYGSFAEYHDGHAAAAGQSKLGWALAATALALAASAYLCGKALWEQGKRFKS